MKGPKPPNTCCLWGLGMATTVALITRRVGGTKRKYSMVEGEGLYGRREGGSPLVHMWRLGQGQVGGPGIVKKIQVEIVCN